MINAEITRDNVEKSVRWAKLRNAAGLDNIPAEVLRNPTCVDSSYKMITFCFQSGVVHSEFNTGLVKTIQKGVVKTT